MIKICGAGPGNVNCLTIEVYNEIKNAEKVVAFRRIKESLKEVREDIIAIDKVSEALEILRNSESAILLASGDPNFFGIVRLIKSKGIEVDEVLPGITSVQYLFSKLQKPFSDVRTESVHGRDFDFNNLEKDKDYSFLIDKEKGLNFISRELEKLGFKGKLYGGYNLSYDDEIILEVEIGAEIDEPSDLGVVVTNFYVD